MKSSFSEVLPLVEYGVSSLSATGQAEASEACLVKSVPGGTLIAVADGAGPGAEAAKAARLVIDTLDWHSRDGVISLIRRCHDRLRGTRGAMLALAAINGIENTVTWLGVGNIEGLLLRGSPSMNPRAESMVSSPGIAGYRLPMLQALVIPIAPRDLLMITTDGIRRDFVQQFSSEDSPAKIAEYTSSNFAKGPDSGLVLVVRYQGAGE